MYSAGRNARLDEGESELFDNLSLVGVSGRFCGILTERQLTFQDFSGFGIRIKLSNIDTLRNINLASLPTGFLTIGGLGTWVGLQVLSPPIGWVVSAIGLAAVTLYLTMKTPVLSIETNGGEKHLVTGSQSELLRLCMMVDRVMHGSTIEDAKKGLKILEEEIRQHQMSLEPKALLSAPETNLTPEINQVETSVNELSSALTPVSIAPSASPIGIISDSPISSLGGIFASLEAHEPRPSTISEPSQNHLGTTPDSRSAYERAWGRKESPPWYEEKPINHSENRMDEVFSDAMGSFNIFEEGGIFDSEQNTPPSYSTAPTTPTYTSPTEDIGLFPSDSFNQTNDTNPNYSPAIVQSRPPSSSEMIRSAQQRHTNYEPQNNWNLPSPTENAVREECRPGLVRTAKARQAYLTEQSTSSEPTDSPVKSEKFGEDFPAVSKLANSMGNGRVRETRDRVKKQNWIESLLAPRPRRVQERALSYSSEYDDSDGGNYDSSTKFRSSQLLRLRSDQDHQADVANRVQNMNNSPHSSSAKDALDNVITRVSNGETHSPQTLNSENKLQFNQLRRTNEKDKRLPGIRHLD